MAPEKPRISVHDYIDSRLDEQDARIGEKFETQDDKIERRHIENKLEIRELRGWFLMLSGPGWAALFERISGEDITVAVTFSVILIGLLVIFFYRTRKPINPPD